MTQPKPTLSVPERIVTERLVLRPPRDEDAEAIIAAIEASRSELEAWMDWAPSMHTVDDARAFVRRVQESWSAGDEFSLGIFRRIDGRYIGGTGMHRPNWAVPSFEIGYWMSTPETGKGYVRETVAALTRVGFGQLGLKRIMITCAATNNRSRRVAEAAGYQLEGRLRNHGRLPDGSLRDTLVYSLIDTDDAVRESLAGAPST